MNRAAAAAAAAAARPPNPATPYREDCWSEGATSTLIDAWGERYLELNGGNIRQKHWKEVADIVNSRRTVARRPSRTDVQCKNRIDTLKKKYKTEKARIIDSGRSVSSPWPFFERLDLLMGRIPSGTKKASPPVPLALPLPYRKGSPLPAGAAAAPSLLSAKDSSFLKRKYSEVAAAAAAAHKDEEAESESSKSSTERSTKREKQAMGDTNRTGGNAGGDEEGVHELARAILQFGEIYERVEAAKQEQLLELEKQRMEFVKCLEFQRMQIFVDSQIQLEKLKRSKRAASGENFDIMRSERVDCEACWCNTNGLPGRRLSVKASLGIILKVQYIRIMSTWKLCGCANCQGGARHCQSSVAKPRDQEYLAWLLA